MICWLTLNTRESELIQHGTSCKSTNIRSGSHNNGTYNIVSLILYPHIFGRRGKGVLTDDIEDGTDEQDRYSSEIVTDLGVGWLSCCGYDRTDDADC
jgi:hypothetical protein